MPDFSHRGARGFEAEDDFDYNLNPSLVLDNESLSL